MSDLEYSDEEIYYDDDDDQMLDVNDEGTCPDQIRYPNLPL